MPRAWQFGDFWVASTFCRCRVRGSVVQSSYVGLLRQPPSQFLFFAFLLPRARQVGAFMSTSSLPSARSWAWQAFRSGGLWSFVLRPASGRPGWSGVCVFRTPAAAQRFAAVAVARCGQPVDISSEVVVTVPVFVRHSRVSGLGCPVSAAGGLRPFAASLRRAGWSLSGG